MKKWLLVGVGMFFPVFVHAQDQGRAMDQSIEKVTAKAHRLDTNGDGWLTEDETSKGRKTLGLFYDRIAHRVDANHDGKISVEEYIQAQVNELRQADTNGDGWISESEGRAQKRKLIGELLRNQP